MTDAAMVGKARYARAENDAYYTPAWCTEALLRHWWPNGDVWEPAAGRGDIAAVLEAEGIEVRATDLVPFDGAPMVRLQSDMDFLTCLPVKSATFSIITNPPYKKAEAFIRKALELTGRGRGAVAMLLRNEYDCAKSRQTLFEQAPFARKIVLTTRPKWIEGSKGSPRHNYSWFIWDWRHRGPATLEYAK